MLVKDKLTLHKAFRLSLSVYTIKLKNFRVLLQKNRECDIFAL